jgi:N-acetylneuraminic acid mutarotase
MNNATLEEYSGLDNAPSPRASASISYYNYALYVFGGTNEIDNLEWTTDKELYKFDMRSKEWSIIEMIGEKPPGMHLHNTLVYDGYLYIVYGYSIELSSNIADIWRISLDNPTNWEKFPLANSKEEMQYIPRSVHGVVENDGVMYMFGGYTISGSRNDLLSLDLKKQPYKWTVLSKNGTYPPSRRGHTTFQLDDHIYIFGGENEGNQK